MRRQNRTAGRPRLDKTHRESGGSINRDLMSAGGHQQAGTAEAFVGQAFAHLNQITRHQRLNIGVGTGSALAFVLAYFRADFA